ncbi:hypothetical protein FPQ18DRAFT_384314 [Pyronema domesticum]|uniref:Uncharacterized protein n=1 Tax=Pyronema omphalodes (strain CBS 100304) TaxID=1076935 RepID=U4L3I3_PYROM|nr:hypothetical protein FPQ18DRAFT_384314 [Pyronema domesticum]CCX04615.1 Protein of unknown function [Pyronema omphalodes CBS 100304]
MNQEGQMYPSIYQPIHAAYPYHHESGVTIAPFGYLIPIDSRLLEIDAQAVWALAVAPVASPGALGNAIIKRKRAYAPRKKSATDADTTCQAATALTALKQRKRKAKVDPPSLATSYGCSRRKRDLKSRKHVSAASTNFQLSAADSVSASAIFKSWSLFVPIPAYNQAADNASAADPDAAT